MKSARAQVLAPQIRCAVGEGPMIVGDFLYWVDILDPAIHRIDLRDGSTSSWTMPEMTGFIVARAGRADFLVGLKSGLHVFSPDPFSLERLAGADPLPPDMRFNDAKVDDRGTLWLGTMHIDGAMPVGALNRIAQSGRVEAVDGGYLCPNGPAVAPDGVLYHADSTIGVVYRLSFDAVGSLVEKTVHIRFADAAWGLPDGMTVDAENCLWIAHWDGGRISRFDPRGVLIEAWSLPCSRITSCTFGGAALDRLFVTSAAHDRRHEPQAGKLFELHPGVRGIASVPFAG